MFEKIEFKSLQKIITEIILPYYKANGYNISYNIIYKEKTYWFKPTKKTTKFCLCIDLII